MRIRDTYAYPARQQPMTVERAIAHSLSDPLASKRVEATTAIVGRLLTVLSRKGVLLPSELLEILGERYQDYDYGTKENPPR